MNSNLWQVTDIKVFDIKKRFTGINASDLDKHFKVETQCKQKSEIY